MFSVMQRILLSLMTVSACLISSCGEPKLKSDKEFTEYVNNRLNEVHSVKATIGGNLIVDFATTDTTDPAPWYLGNVYKEYRNGANLDEIIDYSFLALQSVFTGKFRVDSDLGNIVPVIRDNIFLSQSKMWGSLPCMMKSLNSELHVFFAIDNPTTLRYLVQTERDSIKLTDSELLDRACLNLQSLIKEVTLVRDTDICWLYAGGDYESSFLLFDSLWSKEQLGFTSEIVIAVPARELVAITEESNPKGIARLREVVSKIDTYSHAISAKLFIRKGDSWEIFE